jgi:hypothetical protein
MAPKNGSQHYDIPVPRLAGREMLFRHTSSIELKWLDKKAQFLLKVFRRPADNPLLLKIIGCYCRESEVLTVCTERNCFGLGVHRK